MFLIVGKLFFPKKNITNLVLLQIVVIPFRVKYQLELRVTPFLHSSTHYGAFMEPLYNKSYINNRCDNTHVKSKLDSTQEILKNSFKTKVDSRFLLLVRVSSPNNVLSVNGSPLRSLLK